LKGYRRALREEGITFQSHWVVRSGRDVEASAYAAAKQLVPELRRAAPCAMFCLTDRIARGAAVALREAGLSIPQDVALAGFDDIEAPFLDPPLTSVRQDTRTLGAEATRLLLDMVRLGTNYDRKTILLKPELVVRGSTDAASTFSLAQHYAHRAQLSAVAA
jgi:LacI family transcriptional regulator